MQHDIDALMLDPGGVFATPAELAACAELPRDFRIEALKRWAYDIREQRVAQDEGMPGSVDITLDQVFDALREMGAKIELKGGPPTEHDG
jgi:hypothetical protein